MQSAVFDADPLRDAVWGGLLGAAVAPGRVVLVHRGAVIAAAEVSPAGEGRWRLAVTLPPEVLSEGNHSLLLCADDGPAGDDPPCPGAVVLARLTLVAGSPLDNDLVAEIALLRAELDLLKREVRRLATGS